MNNPLVRWHILILAAGMMLAAVEAPGQIRVVTWNTLAGPATSTDSNYSAVLAAIGSESVNGIAKRIDLVALQEQTSTDTQNVAAILNSIYGVSSYQTVISSRPTSDDQNFVYDSSKLTLLDYTNVAIGTHPCIRAHFRPVGYTSADAEFYAYSIHLKASQGYESQRGIEATAVRSDANALGDGKHIIYSGDFNLYNSSGEPAWGNMLAAGNGQAFDPLNKPGNWHDSSTFAAIDTQSTRLPQVGGGASGGVDDRFDFQFVSGEFLDGKGLSYIGPTSAGGPATPSYRAFGNDGVSLNQSINNITAGRSQPAAVLNALYNASDHLPVVADYQVPAKMSVSVSAVPQRVIVNAAVGMTVNVSNSADVVAALGADHLDYIVSGSGAFGGSTASTVSALAGPNSHLLTVDTSIVGVRTGAVSVVSSSQGVANGTFSSGVSTFTVLDHATASYDSQTRQGVLNLDFGTMAIGSGLASRDFSVYNLPSALGSAADLVVGAPLAASGDTSLLKLLAAAGTAHAGEAGVLQTATLSTSAMGDYSSSWQIPVSDENLPGAASGVLEVHLSGHVRLAGDANGDGVVDVLDLGILASSWQASGVTWATGDFNGDHVVDVLDLGILASNWQSSSAGADSSSAAPSVPEPAVATMVVIAFGALARRKARRGVKGR